MKLVLTTLNSRFTHMSLSLRYLRAVLLKHFSDGESMEGPLNPLSSDFSVSLLEFTINQPHEHILRALYEANPKILCFSVYIWNVEASLKLADSLKKILPDICIIFGGPEVAYKANEYLQRYSFINAISTGEGEEFLVSYVRRALSEPINPDGAVQAISGMVERIGSRIIDHGPANLVQSLDDIPFPYEDEAFEQGRMLYYEASRGCPFRCAYCLSARASSIRTFSLERVKRDLQRLVEAQVMKVKFVDRTFNVDPTRTQAIFAFLIEIDNGYTQFHFEITAELLTQKDFEILSNARPGLFQFEIGIQSTFEPTMAAVDRRMPFEKTSKNCSELLRLNNIHLHLDLIAGLPFETFDRFLQSFDDVYALKPHALQLGFLKLIPGSPLAEDAEKYGYVYEAFPPYEVLENHKLTYEDLARLKRMEALVEIYYNSQAFNVTLNAALRHSSMTPSNFFVSLAEFFRENGYDKLPHRSETHYTLLEEFLKTKPWYDSIFTVLLDYDCLTSLAKLRRPADESVLTRPKIHQALRTAHPEISVKTLLKQIRYQVFDVDVQSLISEMTFYTCAISESDVSDVSDCMVVSENSALRLTEEALGSQSWLGWIDLSHRSPMTNRYTYSQLPLR